MNSLLLASLAAPSCDVLAMRFVMPIEQELGLAIAMVLTFAGMVLHWQLPRHRISLEERIKDGELTESQARFRLQVFSWCAPAVTFVGIGLLLAVMLAFGE